MTRSQDRFNRAMTVLTAAFVVAVVGTLLGWMWAAVPGGVAWRVLVTAVALYVVGAVGASIAWAPKGSGES